MYKKTLLKALSLIASLAILLPTISLLAMGADSLGDETVYLSDLELSDNGAEDIDAFGATPSASQYAYQKQELAAFLHFGMNTFTGSEWGDGKETPAMFTLDKKVDAENYVKLLKEAGFKSLIVTAKHHDGFCIWDSAWTEHDTASTNYPDGDVLEDLSAACTKYDMKMGLYLSPWDENSVYYGYYDENGNPTTVEHDVLDYNDFYAGQLEEILGNDKYGNNGEFYEIWMDGAKGSGADAQNYDFERYINTIRKHEGEDVLFFGAGIYSTVHWIGNEAGVANEETWAKGSNDGTWINVGPITSYKDAQVYVGQKNGSLWSIPEVDARITSGWFWGENKKTPKTLIELRDMYMDSVGHNSVLLLNVPLNNQGTLDEAIQDRVWELGNNIQKSFFENNLAAAEGVTILADSVHKNDIRFKPSHVVDGDDTTYWTAEQGSKVSSLIVDFGKEVDFDALTIEEEILRGQRVEAFSVYYKNSAGEWRDYYHGTTIGSKRVVLGKPVRTTQVRVDFTGLTDNNGAVATPVISHLGVYKVTDEFENGSAAPVGIDEIDSIAPNFDTTGWELVVDPDFPSDSYHRGRKGDVMTVNFTGTKAWLKCVPSNTTFSISVDGGTEVTVTSSNVLFFETEDLAYGDHTITIKVTKGLAQIDSMYVLNNGGKGYLDFEQEAYFVDENMWIEVKVVRKGGTTGSISAIVQDNPGSAVQSSYVPTEGIPIVFEDGETEKIVRIRIKRYTEETGTLSFTLDLVAGDTETSLVKGFNTPARVEIFDAESLPGGFLREIEITRMPDKTEYAIGDALDPTGLVVTGEFNSGAVEWTTVASGNKLGKSKTIPLDEPITTDNLRLVLESILRANSDIPCIGEIEVYNGNDGINLALSAKASAISEYSGLYAGCVNDGDTTNRWTGHDTAGDALPVWVQLKWDEAVTFDRIVIYEWRASDGYRADDWKLETSKSLVFSRELEADEYVISPSGVMTEEGQMTYVVTAVEDPSVSAEFTVSVGEENTAAETILNELPNETESRSSDDGDHHAWVVVIVLGGICIVAGAATIAVIKIRRKK